MATNARMSKVPEWPRPHQDTVSWAVGIESAVANDSTIVPIAYYDEGLGVINSFVSCPQNASFTTYTGAANYPTSKVNKVFCQGRFELTKEAIETDKILGLKFCTMEIHSAFNETGLANDEVSGLDLNEILELQVQTDDRLMTPLYNAIDMKDGLSNAALDMPPDQESLDTDLEIEGVAFSYPQFYNALHYLTNGNKLRSVCTGLKWHTLTRQHPFKKIMFHQHSNTKYMNPYTFLGVFVGVPQNDSFEQIGKVGDTTDIAHLSCQIRYRYNEHNHEFNHALQ